MSNIPLDIQRKCEQRWVARFARPVPPSASHENMDEKPDPAVSPAWKNKEENPPGLSRRAGRAGDV
jgi:hypothetical protein